MSDQTNDATLPQGKEASNAAARRKSTFVVEMGRFVHDVESLETTLPPIVRFLNYFTEKRQKKLGAFLHSKAIKTIDGGARTRYTVPNDAVPTLFKLRKKLGRAEVVQRLLPKSFIVTLVSQYDAYLGRLIRLMYLNKPELLSTSERNITFAQLLEYGSIEEARERVVDKEVDSVLRDSHAEHFDWLEKKLNMPLRKDLQVWPLFIEITERRNLFVHCDGIVSPQYQKVCVEQGVELEPSCQIGKPLSVTRQYFAMACDAIYEIGVKLGHVIWLKLVSSEREAAENNMNKLCLDLISRQKYQLAKVLLEFTLGTLLRKESSASVRWMLTVNLAQTHKWNGEDGKCRELILKHDWSALGYQFLLAVAVLQEDFDKVFDIMKKMGPEGEVRKVDYREWPLFRQLRLRDDFLKVFAEIFGEPYGQDEIVEKQPVALEDSPGSPLLDGQGEVPDKESEPGGGKG